MRCVFTLKQKRGLERQSKEKQIGQKIDRRTQYKGNGSDHDPAWIELNL